MATTAVLMALLLFLVAISTIANLYFFIRILRIDRATPLPPPAPPPAPPPSPERVDPHR